MPIQFNRRPDAGDQAKPDARDFEEDFLLEPAVRRQWDRLEYLCQKHLDELLFAAKLAARKPKGSIAAAVASEYGDCSHDLSETDKLAAERAAAAQKKSFSLSKDERAKLRALRPNAARASQDASSVAAAPTAEEAFEALIAEDDGDPEEDGGSSAGKRRPKFAAAPLPPAGPGTRGRLCDGRVALHHAAFGGAPLTTITALLEVRPDAATRRDLFGSFPVHLAATGALQSVQHRSVVQHGKPREKPEEVEKRAEQALQIIIDAYPEALLIRDAKERLPLHVCVLLVAEPAVRGSERRAPTPSRLGRSRSSRTTGRRSRRCSRRRPTPRAGATGTARCRTPRPCPTVRPKSPHSRRSRSRTSPTR